MTKPTLKLPSNHSLILGFAVLVVLGLIAVSIVSYQRQKQANDNKARQESAQRSAAAAKVVEQQHALQVQVQDEHAKRAAVCAYVTQLSLAKATRSLVTVPVVPCSN